MNVNYWVKWRTCGKCEFLKDHPGFHLMMWEVYWFSPTPLHSMVFMAPISRLVKCIILDDLRSKVHAGFLIKTPASSLLVGEFRTNLISSSPCNSDLLSWSPDGRSGSILCLELLSNSPRILTPVGTNQFFNLSSLIAHREEGNCMATRGPDYLLGS